jgi:hypothetical protein
VWGEEAEGRKGCTSPASPPGTGLRTTWNGLCYALIATGCYGWYTGAESCGARSLCRDGVKDNRPPSFVAQGYIPEWQAGLKGLHAVCHMSKDAL